MRQLGWKKGRQRIHTHRTSHFYGYLGHPEESFIEIFSSFLCDLCIFEAHKANSTIGDDMGIRHLEARGEMLSQVFIGQGRRQPRDKHPCVLHLVSPLKTKTNAGADIKMREEMWKFKVRKIKARNNNFFSAFLQSGEQRESWSLIPSGPSVL
jgi:hypothetical protein